MEEYVKGVEPPDIETQIVGRRPRIAIADDGAACFMLDNDLRDNFNLSCTLAVDVELIRNGESVGHASIYKFNIGALTAYSGPWTAFLSSTVDWSHPKERYTLDQASWEARFTPNAGLAMLDYRADSARSSFNEHVNTYWKGDLRVPVKIERYDPNADPFEFK